MKLTHHRPRLAAGVAATVVTADLNAVTSAQAAAGCRVASTASSQWQGGFGADASVINLGSPIASWRRAWSFTAGQRITQLWNGCNSQSGGNVTVSNASYNSSLSTGGVTAFGFTGSWIGSKPVPASITLNGTTCTGTVGSGSPTPSTTPSAAASASAPPSVSVSASASPPA